MKGKQKILKRLLSAALTVCMVFSLFNGIYIPAEAGENTVTDQTTFKNSFENVGSGDIIRLGADITLNQAVNSRLENNNAQATIDLNGHTLTTSKAINWGIGILKVTDNTSSHNGRIEFIQSGGETTGLTVDSGSLKVTNCTIRISSSTAAAATNVCAIGMIDGYSSIASEIGSGATITGKTDMALVNIMNSNSISFPQEFLVKEGKIIGETGTQAGIMVSNGAVTVNGSEAEVSGKNIGIMGDVSDVSVKGGKVSGNSSDSYGIAIIDGKLALSSNPTIEGVAADIAIQYSKIYGNHQGDPNASDYYYTGGELTVEPLELSLNQEIATGFNGAEAANKIILCEKISNQGWTLNTVNNSTRVLAQGGSVNPPSSQSHTITVGHGEHGEAYADPPQELPGECINIWAQPDTGYHFKEWQIIKGIIEDLNIHESDTHFTMPDDDVEVKAIFEQDTYHVQVDQVANGTAESDKNNNVAVGETVTITAQPNEGYHFTGWTVVRGGITLADPSAATTTFTMPDKDVEVRPSFAKTTYRVTVEAEGGGGAHTGTGGTTQTATVGEIIIIRANAANGYHLKEWQVLEGGVNVTPTSNSNEARFVMKAHDVVVKAVFERNSYSVTVVNATDKGTAHADVVTAARGTRVNLIANPLPGYRLKEFWEPVSGGSVAVTITYDSNKTAYFTMPERNVTIRAMYEAVPYTKIEVSKNPNKMRYVEGEKLSLAGTELKLYVNNTSAAGGYIEAATLRYDAGDFERYGIIVSESLCDGTVLNHDIHNGNKILFSTQYNTACFSGSLTVDKRAVTGMAIKTQPKLNYVEGQRLDLTSMVVTLTYNDGTTEDVPYADFVSKEIVTDIKNGTVMTIEDYDGNWVVVGYKGLSEDNWADTDYLSVTHKIPFSMTVKTQPTKLNYVAGQQLDLTGTVLLITYNDYTTEEVAYEDFTNKGITTDLENGAALGVDDNGKLVKLTYSEPEPEISSLSSDPEPWTPSWTVTAETDPLEVVAKAVTGIAVKDQPTKLNYVEGQKLALAGLTATLTYNDETTEDVAFANFGEKKITASPENNAALTLANNNHPVILSCNKQTAETENLNVAEKNVAEIAILEQPKQLSYAENQKLDLSGLKVRIYYNDGTTKDVTFGSSEFAERITTDIADRTLLKQADHNGKKITLTCGGKNAETDPLTVVKKTVTDMVIKAQPELSYVEGQKLDLKKLIITFNYNDGTTGDIYYDNFKDWGITTSLENDTSLTVVDHDGTKIVVSCEEYTKETNPLKVVAKSVEGIVIRIQPRLDYVEGETLRLESSVVELHYNDGTTSDPISYGEFGTYGITAAPAHGTTLTMAANKTTIMFSCEGKMAYSNPLTLTAKVVNTIAVKTQPKLTYVEGQALDLTGIAVTLTYNDGTTEDIELARFAEKQITANPENGTKLTKAHQGQKIIVSCNGKSADTGALTVEGKIVTDMAIVDQPSKLTYVEGQSLSLTGTAVTLTYNDGTTERVGAGRFEEKKITASPAKGTEVSMDQNGKAIVISREGLEKTVTTEPLTVVANALESIQAEHTPSKLTYVEGQALDLSGTVVTLHYTNGTIKEVDSANFAENNITSAPAAGTKLTMENNNQALTFRCGERSVSAGTLTVENKVVTGIAVKEQPSKLSYVAGQTLNLEGTKVTLTYNDGSQEEVEAKNFGAKNITATPSNGTVLTMADQEKRIVLSCNGKNAETNKLTITEKAVAAIAVKDQPKIAYIEGQALDLTGMKVTVTYNDGTKEEVGFADFAAKGITAAPENGTVLTRKAHNDKAVTVSCSGKETNTQKLTVEAKAVTGIAVKAQPSKLSYVEGQKLNLAGTKATLTYNDGSTKEVAFEDFAAYNITTNPANGIALTVEDHDKAIQLSCNGQKAATDKLSVVAKAVTAIAVKEQPQTTYIAGQKLDLTGTLVTLTYNNGTTKDVDFANFADYQITATPANGTTLAVTDHNKSVKVTYQNGPSANTNKLSVTAKAATNMEVKAQPSKLSYVEGQSLSLAGTKVILTYNDGTKEEVEAADFADYQITAAPANGTVLAVSDNNKQITLSWNGQKKDAGKLTVVAKAVTELTIKSQPSKLSYVEGQNLNLTGTVVVAHYNDGTTKEIGSAKFAENRITAAPADGTALAVTDNNKAVKLAYDNGPSVDTEKLTVAAKAVTSLEVKTRPWNLSYVEGQKLSLAGTVILAHYNDGTAKEIRSEKFAEEKVTTTPADGTVLTVKDHNGKGIVISYGGKNVTVDSLAVAAKTLTELTITTAPAKTVYTEGESFDRTGMVVTAKYNDNTTAVVNTYTVSPNQALHTTDKKVTVTYKEGNVTKTAEQMITVNPMSVNYQTHVQNIGWQDYVKDGALSGTSGQGLRLEGIRIKLDNNGMGGIQYRTQVQNIGWQNYVKDGEMAGTSGQSLRLEGIQIQLTGEMAEKYDIYYRTHIQDYGWLGWAKNGEKSGSAGLSKRLEGIQIVLVTKGGEAPGKTGNAYMIPTPAPEKASVSYQTYIQNIGWQDYVKDGEMSGTSGKGLRLEGIQIKLNNAAISGDIQYRTHVQNLGWNDYVQNGTFSGSKGQGLRMEALQIRLSGEIAEKYDVYYRTHIQDYGWLGWAKNGEESGSEGLSKRIEGIEICLIEKGQAAPGTTENSFVK